MRDKIWTSGNIGVAAICYNEELLIGAWLDHILESRVICNIAIVDCGSTDKTVKIIKQKQDQYPNRIILEEHPWCFNFAQLRNISMNILRRLNCVWALWIDIDTFFNTNPDKMFAALDKEMPFLYNDIRMPALRFLSKNEALSRTIPKTEHWGLLRLATVTGFVGNLHEQAVADCRLDISNSVLPGFFLGHYDLAKISTNAACSGRSLASIMGYKKHRYLKIRKLTGTLSPTDPDPDLMLDEDIEYFGQLKWQDEMAGNPRLQFNPDLHSSFLKGIIR